MQYPYSKLFFAIKTFVSRSIFKMFAGPIATNWDVDANEKTIVMPPKGKPFSQEIQYQTSDFTH